MENQCERPVLHTNPQFTAIGGGPLIAFLGLYSPRDASANSSTGLVGAFWMGTGAEQSHRRGVAAPNCQKALFTRKKDIANTPC